LIRKTGQRNRRWSTWRGIPGNSHSGFQSEKLTLENAPTDALLFRYLRLTAGSDSELRHRYAICYYPSNSMRDGSFRRIRIDFHDPGYKVRSRAGYRVSSDKQ
jgi:hypothetical protein